MAPEPVSVNLLIGGEWVEGEKQGTVRNPACVDEVVGHFSIASEAQVDAAEPGAIVSVNLPPYHALGTVKYEKLQKEYKLTHIAMPTREQMTEIKGWCESEIRGRIPCSIGG